MKINEILTNPTMFLALDLEAQRTAAFEYWMQLVEKGEYCKPKPKSKSSVRNFLLSEIDSILISRAVTHVPWISGDSLQLDPLSSGGIDISFVSNTTSLFSQSSTGISFQGGGTTTSSTTSTNITSSSTGTNVICQPNFFPTSLYLPVYLKFSRRIDYCASDGTRMRFPFDIYV